MGARGSTWVALTLQVEAGYVARDGDVELGLDDLRWRTADEVVPSLRAPDAADAAEPVLRRLEGFGAYGPPVLLVVAVPVGTTSVTLEATAEMGVRYADPDDASAPDVLGLRWTGDLDLR